MAIKVKPISEATQKLVSRASGATQDYRRGIERTDNQAENAIAAEDAYRAGLQESFTRNARVKGLEKSGNKKWQERSLSLGANRFATGVRAGAQDYAENVKPYFEMLSRLELPPRGPKGSPENFNRSRVVGEALHQQKIQG